MPLNDLNSPTPHGLVGGGGLDDAELAHPGLGKGETTQMEQVPFSLDEPASSAAEAEKSGPDPYSATHNVDATNQPGLEPE